MEASILVIAYNRVNTLDRLLKSLDSAKYPNKPINLIISIDNSGTNDVLNFSQKFEWKYGNKIIIHHEIRLGLKKHIMLCGNLTKEYGNLIVLEDDIFVAPDYYYYSLEMLKHMENDDRIAGASLYSFPYNLETLEEFVPLKNSSDNYYMQYACSWGQIWTEKKWSEFKEWYDVRAEDENLFLSDKATPKYLNNWPASSWLKYHIKYCIETDKFFTYPYDSRTTNFNSVGEHSIYQDTTFQSYLILNDSYEYSFSCLDNAIKYDAYFESLNLKSILGLENILINIYGQKMIDNNTKYVLTTEKLNYKIIEKFELSLKPVELNIIYSLKDSGGIYLYDCSIEEKNIEYKKDKRVLYFNHLQTISDILKHALLRLKIKLFSKRSG